ncbi:MAG: SMP-30/gluconolactonase/LRE family protein [Gemmataceae bacterium]
MKPICKSSIRSLLVEELERRDCPAAPSLTLHVTMLTQQMIELSGVVTDENPELASVEFSGVASGTVSPDAAGNFSFTTNATGLGDVIAQALDIEGLLSAPVDDQVTSNAPQIINFSATEHAERVWSFHGKIIDESPGGLSVSFSGLPSLQGQSTLADAAGNFNLIVRLQPGEGGTVAAVTTDWWGLQSNQAEDDVQQTNPVSFDLPQANSYPHRIISGPGNALFFTEAIANRIGRMDATTGEVVEVSVSTTQVSPLDLTLGADGYIYYTEHLGNVVGKLDPNSMQIVDRFDALPTSTNPGSIITHSGGDLLFTTSSGIGRFNPETESYTPYTVSGSYAFLDLVLASDGQVWFTHISYSGGAVGRLDLSTGSVVSYDLAAASIPSGIVVGPDGNVWVTDVLGDNGDSIYRITPSGTITAFHTPTAWSGPQHIVAAPDGYLYATEYYIGKLVRIATDGTMVEIDIPTPSNGAFDITVGPDGHLWFTQASANLIGSYVVEVSMMQMAFGLPDVQQIFVDPSQVFPDGTARAGIKQREIRFDSVPFLPDANARTINLQLFSAATTELSQQRLAGPDEWGLDFDEFEIELAWYQQESNEEFNIDGYFTSLLDADEDDSLLLRMN